MKPIVENPAVTLIIFLYNQEEYVKFAIESALEQTYHNLSIIISDDASADRSFPIAQDMVRNYKGPHQVMLNRNPYNLGIGAHVNHVMTLATGDIIVAAAADDISRPQRVMRTVDAFKQHPNCTLVHSAATVIDAQGVPQGIKLPPPMMRNQPALNDIVRYNLHYIGATGAWRAELWSIFGPIDNAIVCEDRVIPARAAALGKIIYIDEPLVLYRSVGISSSFHSITGYDVVYGNSVKWNSRWRDNYRNIINDLNKTISKEAVDSIKIARLEEKKYSAIVDLSQSYGKTKRELLIKILLMFGVPLSWRLKMVIMYSFPRAYMYLFDWKVRRGMIN